MSGVRSELGTGRVLAGAGVVLLAFLALALPAARTYDTHIDRVKPLYSDLAELESLEQAQIRTHGSPLAESLDDHRSTFVGGAWFRPSAGVVLEARRHGTGFCLRGHDHHGDTVPWQCHEAEQQGAAR